MWYVLQVKTGKELDVRDKLTSKGYQAAVPVENRLNRRAGSWTQKEYVLMPSYVFVQLTYDAYAYYRVKEVPGTVRFLGPTQMDPTPLTYIEAEWIRILSNNGKVLEPSTVQVDSEGGLTPVGGILAALRGRVKKYDRHARWAQAEIYVCGEPKNIELSFDLLNDLNDA